MTDIREKFQNSISLLNAAKLKRRANIYEELPHAVHDRYLIVDEDVWLLGTSVKDMGRSLCTVIKVGFSADQVMEMVNH